MLYAKAHYRSKIAVKRLLHYAILLGLKRYQHVSNRCTPKIRFVKVHSKVPLISKAAMEK